MSDEIKIHCSYDQMVDVRELKEHPKNNNSHPKKQIQRLAKIIEANGFRRVITVSRLSGYVVAGHARLSAAMLLGMKEVPVNFQDYKNEDMEYADLVADNALQLWSDIDLSMINLELENFSPDFDLDLLGLEKFTLEIPEEKINSQNSVTIKCNSSEEATLMHAELTSRGLKCTLKISGEKYG